MENIDKYVGSFVSLINEKMSLIGFLRRVDGEDKYRLDIRNQEGFYIFSKTEILGISTDNSIMIIIK